MQQIAANCREYIVSKGTARNKDWQLERQRRLLICHSCDVRDARASNDSDRVAVIFAYQYRCWCFMPLTLLHCGYTWFDIPDPFYFGNGQISFAVAHLVHRLRAGYAAAPLLNPIDFLTKCAGAGHSEISANLLMDNGTNCCRFSE
jgi:hypothetical protein